MPIAPQYEFWPFQGRFQGLDDFRALIDKQDGRQARAFTTGFTGFANVPVPVGGVWDADNLKFALGGSGYGVSEGGEHWGLEGFLEFVSDNQFDDIFGVPELEFALVSNLRLEHRVRVRFFYDSYDTGDTEQSFVDGQMSSGGAAGAGWMSTDWMVWPRQSIDIFRPEVLMNLENLFVDGARTNFEGSIGSPCGGYSLQILWKGRIQY